MSEHFGDAFIFIRPDASKFREELLAELTAQTKGIKVNIPVTAATTKASTQSKQLATSHKAAGAAAANLSAQQATLAKATSAQAAAEEALVKVETADELTTTALAGAKAKYRASLQALTAAQKANELALKTTDVQLQANTAATLAAAEASVALTRSVATEGVAHERTARQEAVHAAQHHALLTGARAAGAGLTGLRGATLATSGGFLIGAASVKVLEEAIHEASAETEAAARVNKVFGDSAEELEHDAAGLADAFGISTKAALQFEGRLGTLFKNAGIEQEEAAKLSEGLTHLTGDLAAFNDVPVAPVQKAVFLALVGNSRGLRQYGIELNQSRVNQIALTESGKKHVNQLTQEERIRARLNLLAQQTIVQQGAAERRNDSLAQSEKELKANLENLGGTLGRAIIPKVTELVQEGSLLVGVLGKVGNATEELASLLGGSEFGHAIGQLDKFLNPTRSPVEKFKQLKGIFHTLFPDDVNRPLEILDEHGEKTKVTFDELHRHAEEAFRVKALADLQDGLDKSVKLAQKLLRTAANIQFNSAARSLDRVREKMDDIRIAGGDAGDVLANLEEQAAAARRKVEAASAAASLTVGGTGHDTAIQRRREAKSELADILGQIRDIREKQAQDIVDALADVQKQIEDAKARAQDLIDKANQDTQDLIEALGRPAEIKQLRVEATKSLQDDLAFQKDLQRLARARIALALNIIGDEKTKAQIIHEQTVALIQSQIAEKQLRAQIKANALERKRAAREAAETSLDLDIEFAQTTKNRTAELRAHQAKIKFLLDLQSHTKRGTNEWKRLRNEIAAERAAIKALRGDLDKQRQDLLALQFEFLQAQSGFAANVLSNILPTSTLAGTVGGGIATPTSPGRNPAVPAAGFATGVHTRDNAAKGSATASANRGASAGQMSSLIAIQRQTLHLIGRLVNQRSHPEATHQRVVEGTSMDTV